MIVYEDIHLRLGGKPVLRGFDWRPTPGALNLLVGANGAGKSSALKIGAGLWRADSGQVLVNDTDVTNSSGGWPGVAYLPQAPAFHPRLRVVSLLRFYARIEGHGKGAAEQALKRFGLESHARHRSAALSGGLRQRLGLAVLSLASDPVWLLDEPGLSLDPFWRRRLQSWLREVCSQGRTVLVATHLLAEWEGHADQCFLCESGRVVGTVDVAHLRDALPGLGANAPEEKEVGG